MLHKSFKPAKCKTALKLATSRTKLLKNKKGVQLNQMKRELAQLLETGQDQTARIRVEHVIREEKMIAAFDLIEIYCELIAARLPIIESQKNCPIDLKEAITSVIFAAPRCADIPELQDARKHFTAKYGKEFITAAVELRPDCGVSRMMVEKLSATAPDGQTKIKVLNAIAEEHNIKWEPKSFGEKDSKPPDDLLNGPNTFEKASQMHREPPKFQAPNVPATPIRDQKHDEPLNFSEQNIRSSLGTQKFASTDTGAYETPTSHASHPDVRPSEIGFDRMEVRQSFPGDGNTFSLGKQNGNMEFKDATSAAEAAAEAAELASRAARAAAELSSRRKITRQYSNESQKSNIHGFKDEGPGKYDGSKFSSERLRKDSANNSFLDRYPRLQSDQIDGNEHHNLAETSERRDGHGSTKRSSRTASLRSSKASMDDETLAKSVQKADRYSRKSSFEEEAVRLEKGPFSNKKSMERRSIESEVEFVTERQDSFKSANSDDFEEERIRKHSSAVSSHSHSNTFADEDNVSNSDRQKFGNYAAENPFAGIDQGSIYRETLVNNVQKADGYSRKSSFEEEVIIVEKGPFSSGMSMKEQSRESEVEFVNDWQDGLRSAHSDYFGEEKIQKQSSASSSRSHSSTFADDYNVPKSNLQKVGNDAAEDLFVSIDQGSIYRDTIKTSSYDDDAVAFDGFDSDGDSCRFDIGPKYDEGESTSYFASPGRKSPIHPSTNTVSWSPRRDTNKSLEKSTSPPHFSTERHSSPMFSESLAKSVDFPQSDEFVPVTFDDSDASNSDSDGELEKSRFSGTKDSSILSHKQDVNPTNPDPIQSLSQGLTVSSFAEKGNSGSDRRPWLGSSSDDLDSIEVSPKSYRGAEFNADSPQKFNFNESVASHPSPRLGKSPLELKDLDSESSIYNRVDEGNRLHSRKSSRLSSVYEDEDNVCTKQSPDTLKDDEFLDQSSSDSGKELNFGTLTGGLRNKGYRRPPYTRSPSGDALSSSKKAAEESSTTIEQTAPPTVGSSFNSRVSRNVDKKASSRSESDNDDSRVEFPQQTLSSRQEPYAQKANKELNKKSSLRAPVTYFDSDSGDSEEDLPKHSVTSGGRSGSGFSRRTKASPSSSGTLSYSKVQVRSESSVNSSSDVERKPTRSSYGAETPPKPLSQTGSPDEWGSHKQPRAASKPMPESRIPESMTPSSKGSLKSSAAEQPSSASERKPARSSYGAEIPPKPWSQIGSSDQWGNREQPTSAKQAASKPMPEMRIPMPKSKIPSREGSLKSSATEQPYSASERKPTRSSYGAETPAKPRTQTGSSDQWGNRERPTLEKQAASKPISEARTPMPESKIPSREGSLKSSAAEQQSSLTRKTIASGSTENLKTSTLSVDTSTREQTDKKAGHVHPKLPDYDTLAAHFQSLRSNR